MSQPAPGTTAPAVSGDGGAPPAAAVATATTAAAPAATAPVAAATPAAGAAPARSAQERLGTSDWWVYRPPNNARPYYFNAKTRVTSWTRPTDAGVPPEPAAATQAVPAAAAVSGATAATAASPAAPVAAAPAASDATTSSSAGATDTGSSRAAPPQAAAASAPTTGPSSADVSAAWREYSTPEGRTYYHNPLTRKTVWQRPLEMPPPAGAIVAQIRSAEDKERVTAGIKAELARRAGLAAAAKANAAAAVEQRRIDEIHASRARRAARQERVASRAAEAKAAVLARRIALMGPAGDPATAAAYPSRAAAEAAFAALLEEKEIGPEHSWQAALPLLVRDPRYGALSSLPARRAAFHRFLETAAERRAQRERDREVAWRAELDAALAGEGAAALELPEGARWSTERVRVFSIPAADQLRRLWAAQSARRHRGPAAVPMPRDWDAAEDGLRERFYAAADAQQRRRAEASKQRRRALYRDFQALLWEHTLLGAKPASGQAPAELERLLADAARARGPGASPPLVYAGAPWRTALADPRLSGDARYAALEDDEERLAVFDVITKELAERETGIVDAALAACASEISDAEAAFVAHLNELSVGAVDRYCALTPEQAAAEADTEATATAAAAAAAAETHGGPSVALASEPAWLTALLAARNGAVPRALYPLTPIAPPAYVFAHTGAAVAPALETLRALFTRPVPRFEGVASPLLSSDAVDARLDALVDRWSAALKQRLQRARRIFTGLIQAGGAAVALQADFTRDFEARWADDARYNAAAVQCLAPGAAEDDEAEDATLSRAHAFMLFCTEKDRVLFAARRCFLRETEARAEFTAMLTKCITPAYLAEKLARRERDLGRNARNEPLDSAAPAVASPFKFVMSPHECLPYEEAVAKLGWDWAEHMSSLRRDLGAQAGQSDTVLLALLGDEALESGRQEVYYTYLTQALNRIDEQRSGAPAGGGGPQAATGTEAEARGKRFSPVKADGDVDGSERRPRA